ncbi:MAG: hypothetical protein GYA50_05465, partial [Eubacteriaceae bacterium]|nr:hypothetical protein [Eubacteriaceae bacterium]
KATKIIVFILCAALAAAAWMITVFVAYQTTYQSLNIESVLLKQYKDSNDFIYNHVLPAYNDVYQTIYESGKMPKDCEYYYYVSNGDKSYTNVSNANKAFFAKYDDAFYSYERGVWSFGAKTNTNSLSLQNIGSDFTVYIAFSDAFFNKHQQVWQTERDALLPYVESIIICLILSLLFFIWSICVTGRKPKDKQLHLSKFDKIYSDILLVVFAGLTIAAFCIIYNYFNYNSNIWYGKISAYNMYAFALLGVCTFAMFMLSLAVFLSMVRKIKAKKLLKHSLIFTICYKIYDFFRSLFDGRTFNKYPLTKSLFYRQMLFIVLSFVLVLLTLALVRTPVFIAPFLLEAVLIYWFIKGSRKTYDDINKGFNESLEEQMRAERMKIALVTNVSHDLKTPLTSIISYVDLISKEEGLTDTVRDYVSILAE